MTELELKNCPRCGSEANRISYSFDGMPGHYITCSNRDCLVYEEERSSYETFERALEHWNFFIKEWDNGCLPKWAAFEQLQSENTRLKAAVACKHGALEELHFALDGCEIKLTNFSFKYNGTDLEERAKKALASDGTCKQNAQNFTGEPGRVKETQ